MAPGSSRFPERLYAVLPTVNNGAPQYTIQFTVNAITGGSNVQNILFVSISFIFIFFISAIVTGMKEITMLF